MRGTCSPGFKLTSVGPEAQVLPGSFADASAQTMVLVLAHPVVGAYGSGIATDAFARASRVRARRGAQDARRRAAQGDPPRASCRPTCSSCATACTAQAAEFDEIMTRPTGMEELLTDRLGAQDEQHQGRVLGDGAADRPRRAADHRHRRPTRTTRKLSVGRQYRDSLSASLMISNDRIFGKTASMLLVHKDELNARGHTTLDSFYRGLVEHGLIVPVRRAGRLRPRRGVRGCARALQRAGRRRSRADDGAEVYTFPPVIDRTIIEQHRLPRLVPATWRARCSASSARTQDARRCRRRCTRRRAVGRHAGHDRRRASTRRPATPSTRVIAGHAARGRPPRSR